MFGERALAVILNEYKQLDQGLMPKKPVFGPMDYYELTTLEKRKLLKP